MIDVEQLVVFGGPADGVVIAREAINERGIYECSYPNVVSDDGASRVVLRTAHYRVRRYAWTNTRTGEKHEWSALVSEGELGLMTETIGRTLNAIIGWCWFLAGGWERCSRPGC